MFTNCFASRGVLYISCILGPQKHQNKRIIFPKRPAAQAKDREVVESLSLNPLLSSPTKPLSEISWESFTQEQAITLLSVASLGFLAVSGDVFLWHNLQWLDQSVHNLVHSTVPQEFRTFARYNLSNTPIVLGYFGWTFAALSLAFKSAQNQAQPSSGRAVRHFAIAAAFYLFGGGSFIHGDPWLVDVLKHIFQRTRPIETMSTYAFPSGHSTAIAFMIGALLFIILPAVVESKNTQTSPQAWKWWIWGLCVLCTTSGRILADVHWMTDVLSGICLGAGLVGAAALACIASDGVVERLNENKTN